MKFLENFREKIGYKIICSRGSKLVRNKTFHNLDSAKTIGILFNATSEQDYQAGKELVYQLMDMGKSVDSIGFVELQENIGKYVITSNMNFFALQQKGFFMLPKEIQVVEEFVSQKFDMLINVSPVENIMVDYIMSLSKASFKISPGLQNDDFADFIINFSSKNTLTSKAIIAKVKEYLTLLDKQKN